MRNFKNILTCLFIFLSVKSFSQPYQEGTSVLTIGNTVLSPSPVQNTFPICDNNLHVTIYFNDPVNTSLITNKIFQLTLSKDGLDYSPEYRCPSTATNPRTINNQDYKYQFTFDRGLNSGTYHVKVKVVSSTDCIIPANDNRGELQTDNYIITCNSTDASYWNAAVPWGPMPYNCIGNMVMKTDGSQVFYRGSDNRMNVLNRGTWGVVNYGLANVAGDLAISYDSRSVYYRGTDGKLNYEFWLQPENSPAGWAWGVLGNATNVAGSIAVSHNNTSVYYRGTDNKMYVYWYSGGQWNWGVLGSATNVAGDLCISADDNNIFYRGTDSKLYVYYYQNGWKWGVVRNDINNVAGSIRYTFNTNFVNYLGTDNKIYWVKYNGGWQWGVLTNSVSDVAGDITLSSNSNIVNYRSTDGRLKYIAYVNGGWNQNGYIKQQYFNVAGDVLSSYDGMFLVYRTTDNQVGRYEKQQNSPKTVKSEEMDRPESKVDVKIDVYPNPTSNNIIVSVPRFEKQKLKIEGYNMEGKLVYSKSLGVLEQSLLQLNINVSTWTKGIYLIKIVGDKTLFTKKILIQ